jgi:hypothetical protein
MHSTDFSTREECEQHLACQLSRTLPPEVAEEVAEHAVFLFMSLEQVEPPSTTQAETHDAAFFINSRIRWVVRDKDLQLVQTICSSVITAVGISGATGNTLISAVAGLASGILQFLFRAKRLGVHLDHLQHAVLVTLHQLDRARPEQIADRLAAVFPDTELTAPEIAEILKTLQSAPASNGEAVGLVESSQTGTWRTCDL